MCAQLCILRADCAQVPDVCMCSDGPCVHVYAKTEFVYDPTHCIECEQNVRLQAQLHGAG